MAALKRRYSKLELLTRTHDRGYGHSILDGLRWAREHGFDQAITMDADFSHDYKQIPAMRNYAKDFVVGSRYVPGGGIENWSWYRRLLSLFSNLYVRTILGVPIHDMTTGFMLYNKFAIERLVTLGATSEGYAFLVAGKYHLLQSGLTVVEHPFVYPERREGQSKMSWRVIWESVWMPWRLRFRKK
jgi:dolichol-phosphate mannosyltransferase